MQRRPGLPEKRLLDPRRVRRIRDGFSWIDRRFVRDGWAERLSREAVLVYLFLVAVADKDGLSFWGDVRVAGTLKIRIDALAQAREELVRAELIAYECPHYQVLDLTREAVPPRTGGAEAIAEVLRRLTARREP